MGKERFRHNDHYHSVSARHRRSTKLWTKSMWRFIALCLLAILPLVFLVGHCSSCCGTSGLNAPPYAAEASPVATPSQNHSEEAAPSEVLICTGSYAYAYHSHGCSGIANCKGSLESISLKAAQMNGRKACKICF